MPVWSLPEFNLECDIWDVTQVFPTDVPAYQDVDCQLYVMSRYNVDATPGDNTEWTPTVIIRVPKGTLINSVTYVQVFPGAARYYKVRWVHPMHSGFSNEYLALFCEPCDSTGATVLQRLI